MWQNRGDDTFVRRIWGQRAPRTKSSESISKPEYLLGSEQWHTSLRSQHFLARCQSDAWDGGSSNILPRRWWGCLEYLTKLQENQWHLLQLSATPVPQEGRTICSLVPLQLPLSLCTHFRLHHNTPCSYPNSNSKTLLEGPHKLPGNPRNSPILCSP